MPDQVARTEACGLALPVDYRRVQLGAYAEADLDPNYSLLGARYTWKPEKRPSGTKRQQKFAANTAQNV